MNEEDVEQCFNLISHLIDRIDSSGHNQVVSTTFTASGLCAYYGINTDEMWTLIEDKIKMYGYENKEVQEYISFFANEAKDNLDKFMSELNIPSDIKVFKKVKNFLDITRTVEESIDSESIDLVSLCISTNFSIFSFDLLESSKKDVIIYKILEKFE